MSSTPLQLRRRTRDRPRIRPLSLSDLSYKWKCANQVRMSKEDMDEDGFELTDDSGDDLTDCESDSEISTLIRPVFMIL